VDQDSGIGGDAAAVEFQLQAAVEIDPQRAIIRFTRWMFHECTTMTVRGAKAWAAPLVRRAGFAL